VVVSLTGEDASVHCWVCQHVVLNLYIRCSIIGVWRDDSVPEVDQNLESKSEK
jgi:hypothetical protein